MFRASIAACLCALAQAHATAAELYVRVLGAGDARLADVVLYVPVPGGVAPASGGKASIHQTHRVFDPFVTVVPKGTAIDFPNDDTIMHHVYSFSPAKRFEIKLYRGMPPAPVVFDVPGIVAVGCNVHDWMLAYVVVLDTPLFAKTDAKGMARIAELPAGRHDLMAWFAGAREPIRVRQLELAADDSRRIDVRLDATPRTRTQAPPLDPIRY